MSSSKRHFTVVINSKEHGLYVSSSPSSAARKAVSKLCSDNKKKKVEFYIRETTQRSNKKVYGPYLGEMKKLEKPIELKGRVIKYKPIVKLNKKVSKMKGGVIIGEGAEGVVLRPNINSVNMLYVSKLIKIDESKIKELEAFELELNRIDENGDYHVRMLSIRPIISNNINKIGNLNANIKKYLKNKELNYKITYEYGGISIENFLENFSQYEGRINENYCKLILQGIANIFQGLYKFYENRIFHLDLHAGNIVFLEDNPTIMRIIDWGNLLDPINNNPGIESLYSFYQIINDLVNRLKEFFKSNSKFEKNKDKITEILDKFLKIPEFKIYKSRNTAVDLSRETVGIIIEQMFQLITLLL